MLLLFFEQVWYQTTYPVEVLVEFESVEKKCEIKEIAFIQRQLMSKSKRQLE